MMDRPQPDTERPVDWLAGGGQMGELIRRTDWSKTPVGPMDLWPQSLRTVVGLCLHSRFPLLIWWGPELVMIYNDAYRPMLGAKHPRALGQRGSEGWSEIWPIIGPMLEGVLKRGEAAWSDDQLLLLERNGYPEECYFTFSYSPILDETGGVGGVLTAVIETTGRKRTEERLKASEAKFAAAFNTSPVVLSLTRLSDGRFVEVNESFVRMSGYTREEVLGRTPEELGLWAHPEQRRAGLERLRAGERVRDVEAEFIVKDGSVRTCLLAADLIPLEGEPHIMTALIDITERKQAEAASAHLAAIVTSSTDAIVSKTLEGIVTSWNASAERIFGYTAQEMIGQPILKIIPPDRHPEEEMILSRIRSGERIEHYETVRRTKDGRYLDISLTISPVRDPNGRIIGASKIARDITERKRAEAALRESEERYRKLAEAQKRFVNDAAHELRAPLTSIQGNLEVLRRFKRMKAQDREEALAEVTREAARLSRLVNDMLALARGDAGMRLRREPIRLDRVLSAAFATARTLGEGRHLELGNLPEVHLNGDADRLKQLALILLENAVSYTPEGGRVRLDLKVEEGWAEFRVSDTGIGIAQEDLERVFERFYRSDKARSRQAGGTGLGLSIAQWIVEQHGGQIGLESEVGQGTTAIVRLPTEE